MKNKALKNTEIFQNIDICRCLIIFRQFKSKNGKKIF